MGQCQKLEYASISIYMHACFRKESIPTLTGNVALVFAGLLGGKCGGSGVRVGVACAIYA